MFISCGDQAGQILRVLLRMTSESGAVAQTFADLPLKAVFMGVSQGISSAKGPVLIRCVPNASRVLI